MKVDLFILNYNGADFILENIDSMLDAVRHSRYPCRFIVIDNASTDNSVALISNRFPSVPILAMQNNRVLCSFNDAVARSDAEVVFLLNSDLKADPHFIDPSVEIFCNRTDVFLVAPRSYLFDHVYEGGRSIPFVKWGMFGTTCHFKGYEQFIAQPGFTFASGFGAFDRTKFITIGGFDDLYLPGRVEDADIGLRAWRMGWKCYYEPKSILYHSGAKSFNARFGKRGTMEIAHRNTFLFIWKNVHDRNYWIAHWLFLVPRLIWSLLSGKSEFATAFFKALVRLKPAFIRRRKEQSIPYFWSDRYVIQYLKNEH